MSQTRNSRSLCRKRSGDEDPSDRREDASHLKLIASLKRELLELHGALNAEREHAAKLRVRRRLSTRSVCEVRPETRDDICETDNASELSLKEVHARTLLELDLCKKELRGTRDALDEACEEREALRRKLSRRPQSPAEAEDGPGDDSGSHPHLDWVGRHYLAVSIPEDRMFKPGQTVTPVAVLHKLFEMRVGDKLASGFSVLLENMNIMLSQTEPEWYAKHFCFRGARLLGNGYKTVDRIDTEEFVWLLFEYGAHAPLIEVLVGLLTVMNNTGKGGVTAAALCTSKSVYGAYVTLFKDTVSKAWEQFAPVRDKAFRSKRQQGVVSVPLTAGLGSTRDEERRGSQAVKTRVLRCVLEGIEAPAHVSSDPSAAKDASRFGEDPLDLGSSIADFMKRQALVGRGKGEEGGSSDVTWNNKQWGSPVPLKTGDPGTSSVHPLQSRVLFDVPWSDSYP